MSLQWMTWQSMCILWVTQTIQAEDFMYREISNHVQKGVINVRHEKDNLPCSQEDSYGTWEKEK